MNNLNSQMYVTKRSGIKEPVRFDKITERISKLINDGEEKHIDAGMVAQKVIASIFSGITTEELDLESAKICANMNTIHPLYNNLAGRILISNLHKKTDVSFVDKQNRIQEITKSYSDKNIGILNEKYLLYVNENREAIEKMINYERDYYFDFFGFKTLERAYLLKDIKTKKIIERPQDMWMRVSVFLNIGNLDMIEQTYNLMSKGFYTHATPTLFNSGTAKANLSSCFLVGTEDSIEGITDTWTQVSKISKWCGGIGLHVSNIRAKGSIIRGTNGISTGIVPMLQVYNNIARYINQCFTGDVKIYTKDGLKSIENIKRGDQVFTENGRLCEVKKVYQDSYKKEALDIKVMHNFDHGVTVTPEHPFRVIKNQKKMTNYSVIENRLKKNLVRPEWIDAKNITEDDLIMFPIPNYEKDISEYTINDCYMYGIMLGDGHICLERNEAGVTFGHSKKELFDFVKDYLELNLINYWVNTKETVNEIRWSISSKFKFTRSQLYDDSKIKYFDTNMLNLPLEKAKYIFKGLVDTDGCVNKEITIELTSKQVLESIKYILLRMGILTSGYSRDRVGNVSTYKNITTRLPTWVLRIPKVEEVCELFDIEPAKYKKYFRYENMLFTRLKSVEKKMIDTIVYDLEIDTNHNYLTEIGLVHNGGKRKGSIAIYLEPHHPDIFQFLDLRKNFGAETERARDLFLALWVSDLFMKQVEKNGSWYLMCPDECKGLNDCWGEEFETLYWKYVEEKKYRKEIQARDLMKAIMDAQIETGTPYICYKDAANRKSNQQNLGTIKSSNLCAEILEYSDSGETAVCNLASIAISKFVVPFSSEKKWTVYTKDDCKYCSWAVNYMKYHNFDYEIKKSNAHEVFSIPEGEELTYPQILYGDERIGGFDDLLEFTKATFNYKELYEVAYTATVNLNNVIDINYYPTIQTKRSNLKHRPIGLGIQGLADTLVRMRINYESQESVEFNKKMMETIYYASLCASKDVAKNRCDDMKILMEAYKTKHITVPEFYDSEIGSHCFANKELEKLYHKIKPQQVELERDINDKCGSYSSFDGCPLSKRIFQFDMWEETGDNYNWESLADEIQRYGVRNSLTTALMPTASTSQILGNNECFEFFTNNIYTRRTLAGDFVLVNKHLINDMNAIGKWSYDMKQQILANDGSVSLLDIPQQFKDMYKTIWEIKQVWSLKNPLARAPFVDQTQSMNIFMGVPDFQRLFSSHMYAWKKGLKTGMYYLRTKPAKSAIKVTVDPKYLKKELEKEKTEETPDVVDETEVSEMCSA